MSGYSTLDDDALRIEIAKRLGYSCKHDGDLYIMLMPGGDSYLWNECGDTVEAVADNETDAWWMLPHWPETVDAALKLIAGLPVSIDYNDVVQWCVRIGEGGEGYRVMHMDTLARAICLSWLAWKDKNEAA